LMSAVAGCAGPKLECAMKLRIEPLEAKRESYSGVAQSETTECSAYVLNFIMQRQVLPKWCWAAISVSLGHYYGTRRWQQQDVASALLGFDCSRFEDLPDVRVRSDECAMLDEALRLAGCYSHWSPGRPTFKRLRTEIAAGRPVCLQIQWYRGGSHFVMVTGYYADTCEIYIEDPLHGPSVQPFDKFPDSYRALGGVWGGTFWTCLPPLTRPESTPEPLFLSTQP
jgi:hypothetical protein